VGELCDGEGASAFGGVEEEGDAGRGVAGFGGGFGVEDEGVGPGEVLEDGDGEVRREHLRREGVVVADGGDSAEEIAEAAPVDAGFARDAAMEGDELGVADMDVFAPLL